MFRRAVAFSLMLVSGALFYDLAYTHSGRTETGDSTKNVEGRYRPTV